MVTQELHNYKNNERYGYEFKFKSTDTKPTLLDGGEPIPVNTMGFEVDTGNLYFFDDDNTWKLVP